MSDEKSAAARGSEGAIDLAGIQRLAWSSDGTNPDTVLALVSAVRAARVCALGRPPLDIHLTRDWLQLRAALAPFTDSAEVRSDGE